MTITIRQALEKFAQLPLGPSEGRLYSIKSQLIIDARSALENDVETEVKQYLDEATFKKVVTLSLAHGGCNKRTVRATLWRGTRLISVGVSGPRRGDRCLWVPGMKKDTSCRHAEQEVLDAAHGNLELTELWITREPCDDLGCKAPLERYGIEVYVFEDHNLDA